MRADVRDDLRDDPRQPVADAAQRRPADAARVGHLRSTATVDAIDRDAHLRRRRRLPYGRGTLALVAAKPLRLVVRIGPSARRAGDRADRRSTLPVTRGQVSDASRSGRARSCSAQRAARRRPGRRPAGAGRADRLVREPDSAQRRSALLVTAACSRDRRLMIVTVTLNAAIDRTITVPNFQRGQRHRASSGLAARGRQGHQRRARAEDARRAGRRHRPRRRRRRARASSRSSPARRSSTTSSGSRASRAPRRPSSTRPAARTRRSTSGARPCSPDELDTLLEKLDYLTQGAELVVFAGSLPRDVADDFYAEAIHILARAGHPGRARLRRRAAAARHRGGAAARLAEPARGRGASSARSSTTTRTSRSRSTRSPIAAPRNVIITTETGCFALLREEREVPLPRRHAAARPGVEGRHGRRAARRVHRRAQRRPPARGAAARRRRRRRRLDARARSGPLRPAPGLAAPAGGRGDRARDRHRVGLANRHNVSSGPATGRSASSRCAGRRSYSLR